MNNNKIINLEIPENDADVANKKYVDSKLSSIHQSGKNIDLEEKYNINSKQQSFTDLTSHYDNLVSYSAVKDIFLSRRERFPMQTTLNMNQNLIHNLKGSVNLDEAVNLKQFQNSMSTKADLTTTTTQQFKSRIQVPDYNESSHSSNAVN